MKSVFVLKHLDEDYDSPYETAYTEHVIGMASTLGEVVTYLKLKHDSIAHSQEPGDFTENPSSTCRGLIIEETVLGLFFRTEDDGGDEPGQVLQCFNWRGELLAPDECPPDGPLQEATLPDSPDEVVPV